MVVDEHRLAGELEVRVSVSAAVAPAAPRPRLLLRDAQQNHPTAVLPLSGLHVRESDVLLDLTLGEPNYRDLLGLREAVDVLQYARPIRPRIAGGIVPPAWSLRNLTS